MPTDVEEQAEQFTAIDDSDDVYYSNYKGRPATAVLISELDALIKQEKSTNPAEPFGEEFKVRM